MGACAEPEKVGKVDYFTRRGTICFTENVSFKGNIWLTCTSHTYQDMLICARTNKHVRGFSREILGHSLVHQNIRFRV